MRKKLQTEGAMGRQTHRRPQRTSFREYYLWLNLTTGYLGAGTRDQAPMDSNLFTQGIYCPSNYDKLLRCKFRPVQIPSLLAEEFAQELRGFTPSKPRVDRTDQKDPAG